VFNPTQKESIMKIRTALFLLAALCLAALPGVAQVTEEPPAAPPPAPEAAPAPPAPVPVTAPTMFYDKLKFMVDGKAESSGTIKLQFQSRGAAARLITVNVLANSKAQDIARDIHKELTLAGGSLYKIKLSGGVVEVKASSSKNPPFALRVLEHSVTGVMVGTKR
jgi:hypothetical protein